VAGKIAVGFINPTFYANPTAFNDIISGTNQGCGIKRWDPVMGLGMPNAGKLEAVFLGLP
jgi:tripeptidyl-peptidase-1